MDYSFESLAAIVNPQMYSYPLLPLVRIWHPKIKLIRNGVKDWYYNLEEGDQVFISDGKLCNCLDLPTHQITCCMGKIGDTDLQIHCINAHRELIIIKL